VSIILYISSNYKGITHYSLLPGTGTHMINTPAGFEEQAPYTIALVKLSEGPVVTAQLTDLGDQPVEIRMPVEIGMSGG